MTLPEVRRGKERMMMKKKTSMMKSAYGRMASRCVSFTFILDSIIKQIFLQNEIFVRIDIMSLSLMLEVITLNSGTKLGISMFVAFVGYFNITTR